MSEMKTATQPGEVAETRKKLLAKVHILKAQCGMSDENYRFLLQEYFSVDSSKNLETTDLQKLIQTFQNIVKNQNQVSRQDKLILKLWQELFDMGKTGSGSRESLQRWVKRQTKTEKLEWLTTAQKSKVIECLKSWIKRDDKARERKR